MSGQAFLDLQRRARHDGRTTAEYLRLYALEGFLLRLAHSAFRDRFVLKGGVLLAAYDLRRPTADIDVVALRMPADVENIRRVTVEIVQTPLPAEMNDGLSFDPDSTTADVIRENDRYSGVRVRLRAQLATSKEPFHVDVSLGDPIWPAPADISMPRLLASEPIQLRGYPLDMVLAEKIVTALQRGVASTRWRDFADIHLLTAQHVFASQDLRSALQSVASYREVRLDGLDDALDGFAEIGQPRWAAWRGKLQLTAVVTDDFRQVLESLRVFADPILSGTLDDPATWNPVGRAWRRDQHVRNR